METDFIPNAIIIELLTVTLFSFYVEVCFTFWMPLMCDYPEWFHLFVQFVLIGLPQAAIIIVPQHKLYFYIIFGIFGLIGSIFSYLRYKHVKFMMLKASACDSENMKLISKQDIKENLMAYFKTKPVYLEKRSNTISLYQTCIMIMTVTAISAVDFKMFPSKFRKSKTFGLSLMDIGVSLIITVSGLVMAKYLHGPSKLKFWRLLKSSAPLFLFGVIKAIASAKFNIGADEYGKHWNFFINLAMIPFTLLVANILPSVHMVPVICLIWMIGYQYVLTNLDYSSYILKSSNESIFEQNKIGIFSLGGYVCLFLMSCYIGKLYQHLLDHRIKSITCLTLTSVALWAVFFSIVNLILPSRSLANLTYVLWGLANGTLHVTLLAITDSLFPEKLRFIIFAEMISEYRLSTFILANIISTIVKKLADTKSLSLIYTLKIVALYLFISCFAISVLFLKNHYKKLRG